MSLNLPYISVWYIYVVYWYTANEFSLHASYQEALTVLQNLLPSALSMSSKKDVATTTANKIKTELNIQCGHTSYNTS